MTGTDRQSSLSAEANSGRHPFRTFVDDGPTGGAQRTVATRLAESLRLRSGQRVLDIAAGTRSSALAATRCRVDVTSIDIVPARPWRDRSGVATRSPGTTAGPAEAGRLPFESRRFDATVSVFGVVFAEDQRGAAAELIRVTREGGRIGLASWTPDGFVGHLLSGIADALPAGTETEADRLLSWGERSRIDALFGERTGRIEYRERVLALRYRSPGHWLSVHHRRFAPLNRAFARLDCARAALLTRELLELVDRFGEARGETVLVPVRYLECVIRT